MQKRIVTISRQYGSGGRYIGKKLSEKLGIPCYDEKLIDMVRFLIPNYIAEGKNQLVIGIGCTGGHHRSVTVAGELYAALDVEDAQYGIKISHRDINR